MDCGVIVIRTQEFLSSFMLYDMIIMQSGRLWLDTTMNSKNVYSATMHYTGQYYWFYN